MEEKLNNLYEKFGENAVRECLDKNGLNELKILGKYGDILSSRLNSLDELKNFLDFYQNQYGVETVPAANKMMQIIKDFSLELIANKKKTQIEVYEEEESEQPSDVVLNTLNDIKESLMIIHEDRTDEMIFESVKKVENTLENQISKKTDKKATFEQVKQVNDTLEKTNKEIQNIKKGMPKEIGNLYTTKDLLRYLFVGMGIIMLLVIVFMVGFISISKG
ncbi:MAG: hypothetical protein E7189_06910 [Erysipelotrichaceae bacterium]|nr:hypothetical protein [Erysipelotrichaceae bacterium]